ncbi:MAG: alpha/beta hydrolase [Fluviicola sp.]|nr:alpha/beta hydrolase [Fluviicola sp.]
MKIVIICLLFFFAVASFAQNRPQEPKPPFSYQSEDVEFKNNNDGIKLAGTLTYPSEGTNFPAVVLISGSGAQDRNSELLLHKPFLVIADFLTKNGVAVLRVDDRGKGESEGDYSLASLNDFVEDTKAALTYLRTRNEVDTSKIGLIGHSLGGVVARIIASEDKALDFIILLAGTGMRGDQLMLLQKKKIEQQMGMSEEAVESGQQNIAPAYEIILEAKEYSSKTEKKLKKHFSEVFENQLTDEMIAGIAKQLNYHWLFDFIRFDPATALKNVDCRVLALNGSKDLQVPPKENLKLIEEILKSNGNEQVKSIEIEGVNHLFQECKTGLPQEYGVIEQTFSPKVLELMLEFLDT